MKIDYYSIVYCLYKHKSTIWLIRYAKIVLNGFIDSSLMKPSTVYPEPIIETCQEFDLFKQLEIKPQDCLLCLKSL